MRTDSTRRTWQLIGATAALSLGVTLGTGWALRALAQESPPAAPAPAATPATPAATPATETPPDDDAAGPDGDALPEEAARRAPEPVETPDPPELRESADNNISFPVDI
jgi:hypothetical protein